MALPIPCSGQAGQDRGLSAAPRSRHCRGAGLLQESSGDKSHPVAAQGDRRRPCTESLRATAPAAGEPEVEVCRGAQLQVSQQYRGARPPSHQAALRLDDQLQVVRHCVDHDRGHRIGSSNSQAAVFLSSRWPQTRRIAQAAMGASAGVRFY